MAHALAALETPTHGTSPLPDELTQSASCRMLDFGQLRIENFTTRGVEALPPFCVASRHEIGFESSDALEGPAIRKEIGRSGELQRADKTLLGKGTDKLVQLNGSETRRVLRENGYATSDYLGSGILE
jgi:hypothetical protein